MATMDGGGVQPCDVVAKWAAPPGGSAGPRLAAPHPPGTSSSSVPLASGRFGAVGRRSGGARGARAGGGQCALAALRCSPASARAAAVQVVVHRVRGLGRGWARNAGWAGGHGAPAGIACAAAGGAADAERAGWCCFSHIFLSSLDPPAKPPPPAQRAPASARELPAAYPPALSPLPTLDHNAFGGKPSCTELPCSLA